MLQWLILIQKAPQLATLVCMLQYASTSDPDCVVQIDLIAPFDRHLKGDAILNVRISRRAVIRSWILDGLTMINTWRHY